MQLLHRDLWKQLFHHPNAPETIHQPLSNMHKLFCQPIVLSPHIIAWENHINLVCCEYAHTTQLSWKINTQLLDKNLERLHIIKEMYGNRCIYANCGCMVLQSSRTTYTYMHREQMKHIPNTEVHSTLNT